MAALTGTTNISTQRLLQERSTLALTDPRRAALRIEAVEQNLALSRRLAHRYAGRGEDLEDLRQVAAHALVKAVDGYDPERGVPFVAYACPYILGALKRHFRDTAWGMRVPRTMQELNHQVTIAVGDLGHSQARTPSQRDVAEHLNITVDAVQRAAGAARVYRLTSLDAGQRGSEGGDLLDLIGSLDSRLGQVDEHVSLQPLLAALSPRERRMIALRFDHEMTQSAIAAELGISQMHVSRLLKRALAALRTSLLEPDRRVHEPGTPAAAARRRHTP